MGHDRDDNQFQIVQEKWRLLLWFCLFLNLQLIGGILITFPEFNVKKFCYFKPEFKMF